MTDVGTLARGFCDAMLDHHADELAYSETIRNAVIVKTVALTALAFGMPTTSDDGTETVDAILAKLKAAIEILEEHARDEQFL
jgi:hypothetical protein